MTKVTHYMYSCDTCCKIREMMEIDGLDCVKCQIKKRDMMRIMGIVNDNRRKLNSVIFFILSTKTAVAGDWCRK